MPLVPALGQADLCESEVSLVYTVSFRTGRTIKRVTVSKKQKKKNTMDYAFDVISRTSLLPNNRLQLFSPRFVTLSFTFWVFKCVW